MRLFEIDEFAEFFYLVLFMFLIDFFTELEYLIMIPVFAIFMCLKFGKMAAQTFP